MNDISFPYVVLRNWDGLPQSVVFGQHGDLDLLVYDLLHFEEVFGDHLTKTYPHPRVQYKVAINNSFIQADIRHLGDGYYPKDFENAVLKTRVFNPCGFFTPDPLHHRLALAYHAVHHKGFIAPEYRRWLGDVSLNDISEALKILA